MLAGGLIKVLVTREPNFTGSGGCSVSPGIQSLTHRGGQGCALSTLGGPQVTEEDKSTHCLSSPRPARKDGGFDISNLTANRSPQQLPDSLPDVTSVICPQGLCKSNAHPLNWRTGARAMFGLQVFPGRNVPRPGYGTSYTTPQNNMLLHILGTLTTRIHIEHNPHVLYALHLAAI